MQVEVEVKLNSNVASDLLKLLLERPNPCQYISEASSVDGSISN